MECNKNETHPSNQHKSSKRHKKPTEKFDTEPPVKVTKLEDSKLVECFHCTLPTNGSQFCNSKCRLEFFSLLFNDEALTNTSGDSSEKESNEGDERSNESWHAI